MLALRYRGHPELVLEELPIPEISARDILIRPLAVGIDGTDAHVLAGEFPVIIPIVPGHEIAGIVDRIGTDVKSLREGDLVCIEPHEYCGVCRYCRTGREHLCLDKKAFGFHLNGGLAEKMLVPERVAYRVPEGVGPEIGCLTEPLSCCVHAIDRLEPVSGLSVIVFGTGTAGCMLIRLSQLAGLSPIVAVEPQADRRNLAKLFGADVIINPTEGGWKEKALAITGNEGFDFLIDAAGSKDVLEETLSMTARGARLLVFGVTAPDVKVNINPYEVFRKELTIIGTVINPYSFHRAVELLPNLGLENLEISQYSMSQHREAYKQLGKGGKVEITPQDQ